ncbi:MAG: hypothetical protein WDZ62_00820 [Candidatus Pacearchaeota archaeon]
MKKQLTMLIAVILILIFLLLKPSLTGEVVSQEIKLGYCPTMQEDTEILVEKENYKLIRFNSASEVLLALNNGEIDKGLIGRKAKGFELSKDIKETILESGYTLVSNKKGFVEYSQLENYKIYTYLPKDITKKLIDRNSKITYLTKEESLKKINEGEIVLISWDDWRDDFELIVVMNGSEKVKDFRGSFLYKN